MVFIEYFRSPVSPRSQTAAFTSLDFHPADTLGLLNFASEHSKHGGEGFYRRYSQGGIDDRIGYLWHIRYRRLRHQRSRSDARNPNEATLWIFFEKVAEKVVLFFSLSVTEVVTTFETPAILVTHAPLASTVRTRPDEGICDN